MDRSKEQKILVEISSGEKILVPKYEKIHLPDGKKVWITKTTPMNNLVASKEVIIGDHCLGDDEISQYTRYSDRRIVISDNYKEALSVCSSHRRCIFCAKPICPSIVWSSGKKISEKYGLSSKLIFVYGSLCIKYGLEFLTIRRIHLRSKNSFIFTKDKCWVCNSPELQKAGHELKYSELYLGINDNLLYKCKNCNAILDYKNFLIYLPSKHKLVYVESAFVVNGKIGRKKKEKTHLAAKLTVALNGEQE